MSQNVIEIDATEAETITPDYTEFSVRSNRQFQRFHFTELTYNDFFANFMRANKPVIISGIADRWECMNWIQSNSVNFEYLRKCIDTTSMVPVANCDKAYFNAHEKSEMEFGEFLNYWQRRIAGQSDGKLTYLKDWHLRRCLPSYQFYETPMYFASDWLNEFCVEKGCDDYRFVYMGPKGTWTPFHSDVFSSHSWSTNIVGVKRWIFFPPGEETKLCDALGNLPFDLDETLIERSQAICIEVVQRAGETVFVPSGWHHQVYNLDDTISVNHNWFNGCNVHAIWLALKRNYCDVLKEIDDCRDMENFEDHCQLMLRSVFGMDIETFLNILCCVARNRVDLLRKADVNNLNGVRLGRSHAIFDLKAISAVLNDVKSADCDTRQIEAISELISRIDHVT